MIVVEEKELNVKKKNKAPLLIVVGVVIVALFTGMFYIGNEQQTFKQIELFNNLGGIVFDMDDIIDVDVYLSANYSTVRLVVGNPPNKGLMIDMSKQTALNMFDVYRDDDDADVRKISESLTYYTIEDGDTTLVCTDQSYKSFSMNKFLFFISDNIKAEIGAMLALSKDMRNEAFKKLK